jgi:hypothetical protein
LYARTLAPGLTWAFDGADGGDLITAAATGGVPHPGGYPTYLVLASIFLRVPIGPLAFRTNLLSLVVSVLAAAQLYGLVLGASGSAFAASVTAIVFGTAPLVWSQAIITEVYALQALLTVCLLRLLLASRPRRLLEPASGLVAGLGMGNHLMGALLLPLLLLRPEAALPSSEPAEAGPVVMLKIYLERLAGLVAGLAIYLVIPWRASSQSPVNWGNVNSLQTLLSLVSGQMYWDRLHHGSAVYLATGTRSWARLITEQLTLPGLLLALLGLIVLFRPRNLHLATIWVAISSSVLAIVYYSPDSYVYLIPAMVSCAIWIGLGSRWLVELASGPVAYGGAATGCAIVVLLALRGILGVPSMDLSRDRSAEDFAGSILASAPNNAILITHGDESTFALWYFHFALHQRPDVSVVSDDLFAQAWYRKVLTYTYVDLVVPSDPWTPALALARANPRRPVCAATSILPPAVDCAGQVRRGASRMQES